MVDKIKALLKGQLALFLAGRKVDRAIWVFSSTDNEEFNYNSRALFLYVLKNLPEIDALFVINNDRKRIQLTAQYGDHFCETKSLRGMKRVCRAGVWFTSAGLPVYAIGSGKRHTIINLWHGVPLKKIALMESEESYLQKLYFRKIFSDNYTAIVTTAKELVPIMAQSFAVEEGRIKVWGQPRNDELNACRMGMVTIHEKPQWMKKIPESKAVLYAPTYREYSSTAWFPFEDWDEAVFADFLEKQNIVLYLRTHLKESGSYQRFLGERVIDLGSDVLEDITEALPLFDLLITDYSSIYIDYLLLDRPMLFLPYDKEEYLVRRGMNFEYDSVTPGARPTSMEDFMKAIMEAFISDSYKDERTCVNRVLNEVMEPCSEKICDKVLRGDWN